MFIAMLGMMYTFEGIFSKEHVEKYDSDGPNISQVIIRFVFNHFRSHEVDGSATGFGCILNDFSKTKISNFTCVWSVFILLKKDIFTLQIPMDYISSVKILKGIENLQKIIFYLAFGQPSLSFEEIVESFVGTKLQYNIYIKMIFKVSFECNNVLMLQGLMDTDLAGKFLFRSRFGQ